MEILYKLKIGIDVKKGNALYNNVVPFIMKRTSNSHTTKIKILLAHNNDKVIQELVNSINKIDYTEIVGIVNEEKQIYDKIVELKPDMIFLKYNKKTLELMKKLKIETNNIPIFNLLVDKIEDTEIHSMMQICGDKLNSLISEPNSSRIFNIIQDYKKYVS